MAVPVALADTISWTSSSISQGATDQITLQFDSPGCPSGDHYDATVYVLGASGESSASSTGTPCGSDAVFTFPTDFTALSGYPAPSTAVCGEYSYGVTWNVYTSTGLLAGTFTTGHPALAFTVTGCTTVPQFPLGFALLFAVTIPALLLPRNMRNRTSAVSV